MMIALAENDYDESTRVTDQGFLQLWLLNNIQKARRTRKHLPRYYIFKPTN
jgi:hypothetical protein